MHGSICKHLISKALIVVIGLSFWIPRAVAFENPQAVVRAGTDQVLQILREYPQDTEARRAKVREAVNGYFDFNAISRLAVGPQWRSLSPEQRQEFTSEFTKLLFNTYIGDIERYATRKITYSNRSISPDYVVVTARVQEQNGPVTLDYYMHLRDGNWKVYDVAAEGISLVSNYRDQFNSVLANGSFNDLSMMLRQKVAEVCGTNRC